MTRNGAIRWQLHQLYTAELRADHVAGGDQDGSAAPVRVRILCSVSSEASARIHRANSGRLTSMVAPLRRFAILCFVSSEASTTLRIGSEDPLDVLIPRLIRRVDAVQRIVVLLLVHVEA